MSKSKDRLERIGVEIVREHETDSRRTILLRVHESGMTRWSAIVQSILEGSESNKDWQCDVSRKYYLLNGVVRFLWRLIFTGDDKLHRAFFDEVVATATPIRVDSFPLVGRRRRPPPNPATGEIGGAYSIGESGSMEAVNLFRAAGGKGA